MKLLRFTALAVGAALLAVLWWKIPHADAPLGASGGRVSTGQRHAALVDESALQIPKAESRETPTPDPLLNREKNEALSAAALHEKLKALLDTNTDDGTETERRLRELTAFLNDTNAGTIARELTADELHTSFGTMVMERWLQLDPLAAATWISTRPSVNDEESWLVGKNLLRSPGMLEAFSAGLPDGNFKQQLLLGGGLKALETNPQQAISLANRMMPSAEQTNLFETIAFDWSTHESSKALDWMMAVPDMTIRERLVAVGAKAIAVSDPDLAVRWLSIGVKDETLLNATALSVVDSWASKNPSQAAAWLTRFPDPQVREAGADMVARRWAETDPNAAAAWLSELPEGEAILAKWKSEQTKTAPGSEE